MNRDIFTKEANSMLVGLAPHVAAIKIAATLQEAVKELERECMWEGDGDGCYATMCGNTLGLEEGELRDNGVSYCPHCGGNVCET